jgi:hypothetical protein
MIPRSATVNLADDDQRSTKPVDASIDQASLRAALNDCIAEVRTHCANLPDAEKDRIERALASAHQKLCARLGL